MPGVSAGPKQGKQPGSRAPCHPGAGITDQAHTTRPTTRTTTTRPTTTSSQARRSEMYGDPDVLLSQVDDLREQALDVRSL
ncbi:MAG: hypothetical protein OSB43_19600, partial [Nocardioides sp.]|uniref:hypothetical protein n=1 Tax=Nocardioides sp. TaxID=35761 RepID=UPI002392004A